MDHAVTVVLETQVQIRIEVLSRADAVLAQPLRTSIGSESRIAPTRQQRDARVFPASVRAERSKPAVSAIKIGPERAVHVSERRCADEQRHWREMGRRLDVSGSLSRIAQDRSRIAEV